MIKFGEEENGEFARYRGAPRRDELWLDWYRRAIESGSFPRAGKCVLVDQERVGDSLPLCTFAALKVDRLSIKHLKYPYSAIAARGNQ
jgi:hypothetical protein